MEQPRHIQAKGLVLKHYASGEFDRRVVIFAKNIGKITARARGARKITSPFTGRLAPMNYCELMLYKTPRNTWTVTQCTTMSVFEKTKRNLEKSQIALKIMDIIYRCTETDHMNDNLLSLSMETLEALENLTGKKRHIFLFAIFQIKTLETLGVLPSFSNCTKCHRKINLEELKNWHPLEVLCHSCITQNSTRHASFPKNQIKLLNFIRRNPIAAALNISLEPDQEKTLNQILRELWKEQTFSLPKSLDALSMPLA